MCWVLNGYCTAGGSDGACECIDTAAGVGMAFPPWPRPILYGITRALNSNEYEGDRLLCPRIIDDPWEKPKATPADNWRTHP